MGVRRSYGITHSCTYNLTDVGALLTVKMMTGNSKTSYGHSYLRGHSIRWGIFFLVA